MREEGILCTSWYGVSMDKEHAWKSGFSQTVYRGSHFCDFPQYPPPRERPQGEGVPQHPRIPKTCLYRSALHKHRQGQSSRSFQAKTTPVASLVSLRWGGTIHVAPATVDPLHMTCSYEYSCSRCACHVRPRPSRVSSPPWGGRVFSELMPAPFIVRPAFLLAKEQLSPSRDQPTLPLTHTLLFRGEIDRRYAEG